MDVTAVYGAALATVLAAIRIVEWAQNRPRIIVQVDTSFLPSGQMRPAIAFRAHNFGSRPTTLTEFFCIVPRERINIPVRGIVTESPISGTVRQDVPPLPARLDPGGIVTAYWDLEHFNRSEVSSYALIGFRDARGRRYYCVGGLRGCWLRWWARHWGR